MVPTLVAKLAESVVSICSNESVASSHEHSSEIPPTEDCHGDSMKSLLFDPPFLSSWFLKTGSSFQDHLKCGVTIGLPDLLACFCKLDSRSQSFFHVSCILVMFVNFSHMGIFLLSPC